MSKAVKLRNDIEYKMMLLEGNPQFENFYKEELVHFCKVAKKIILQQQQENKQLKEQLQLYETYLNRFFKINNKSYDGKIVLEKLQQREEVIENAIQFLDAISLDKTDKYIAIRDYEEYRMLLDILNKYKKEESE